MSRFKHSIYSIRVGLISALSAISIQLPGICQVSADRTLSTQVTSPDNRNFVIESGGLADNNLFHSFEQFSIPTNGSAYFNQPLTVQNIFSRVTGGIRSSINGEIRANGSANVFLLNPTGLLFGPAATLNIGGSFVGSTAQQLRFSDGTLLNTSDAATPPQLTISQPLGLTLTEDSGPIGILGPGHNLSLSLPSFATVRTNRTPGLQVEAGQTLALAGNFFVSQGGNLTTPGGQVIVTSLSSGEVRIPLTAEESVDYSNVESFEAVQLIGAASIDTSGSGGGRIQIGGQDILLVEGSAILSDTLGSVAGSELSILATESVVLDGTPGAGVRYVSSINADVAANATATGSNIFIETPRLEIFDGGQVNATTFGAGSNGNIVIEAEALSLANVFSPGASASPISSSIANQTSTGSSGNSGDLMIDSEVISLLSGAQLLNVLAGTGSGGDLRVTTSLLEASGTSASNFNVTSGLFSLVEAGAVGAEGGSLVVNAEQVELSDSASIFSVIQPGGSGQTGSLSINTGSLRIANNAKVSAITGGTGDLGDINVNARIIDIQGSELSRGGAIRFTGIFSVGGPTSSGTMGDISVTAEQLSISDVGSIVNRSRGLSSAGDITIDAKEITLSDLSTITAEVTNAEGSAAGNVDIMTDTLRLYNGAQVLSQAVGTADLGDIQIQVDDLEIRGIDFFVDQPIPAAISTATIPGSAGDGGDIVVNAARLALSEGGAITSRTLGAGDSGNIDITAQTVTLAGPQPAEQLSVSTITSNTLSSGTAGDVTITTDEFTAIEGGVVNVNSRGFGAGGNLNLNARVIRLLNGGELEAESSAGDRGSINVEVGELLFLDNGSRITATADGEATGGNVNINGGFILLNDGSEIAARAIEGDGGSIQLTPIQLFQSGDNIISASSELGIDGTVNVERLAPDEDPAPADLPEQVLTPDQLVANSCLVARDRGSGQFIISGAGGLSATPNNPSQSPFETYQVPTVAEAANGPTSTETLISIESTPEGLPVEAGGIHRLADGQVVLARQCQT